MKYYIFLFCLIGVVLSANSEYARCIQENCFDLANKCLPDCLDDESFKNKLQSHPRCLRNEGKRITMPDFEVERYYKNENYLYKLFIVH